MSKAEDLPIQASLFEEPSAPSFVEGTLTPATVAFTAAIGEAALSGAVVTEEDALSPVMEDLGYRPSETGGQNPPRIRRPDKRSKSPRAGMSREEARAEDHEEYAKRTLRF